MLWTILALPLLVWLWLGIAFVIIRVILYWMQWEYQKMSERARIIRYTSLANVVSMPGLLSFFDEGKNILHIDHELAASLPTMDRERLEMTEHVFTRKAAASEIGLRFKPYVTLNAMQAAQ